MKAFLLAAGLGTRLRPLTDDMPKCLVPVNGKPMLEYWFMLFEKHGITEVLINLHYLAEQVQAFLANCNYPFKIETFYEASLLGSGGTLWANRSWVEDEDDFLIAYADNLTNANLADLVQFHKSCHVVLTMGLFKTKRPEECGIAVLDEQSTVVEFVEKPQQPKSNLANAGIYVSKPGIFEYFSEKKPLDLGFDVLPQLVGEMKGFFLDAYLIDIGNMERYRRAQKEVKYLAV